nr:homocysteine S-methyltransferase family protein [Chloroflexota bacterium]
MSRSADRTRLLHEALAERILVFDGPQGTYLQSRDLTAADYGGPEYEGCPEQLAITRPDVIADMSRSYLEAGADLIETNTFGAMSIVLAEYGLQDRMREINAAAVRIARDAAAEYETPSRPRFV